MSRFKLALFLILALFLVACGQTTPEETADALPVSPQTEMRVWRLARAWLARELSGDALPGSPNA